MSGSQILLRELCEPATRSDAKGFLKSRPVRVWIWMPPPSEPSVMSAVEPLTTSTLLIKSAESWRNSVPRPAPPPYMSVPPADCTPCPSISTRVRSGPLPRTATLTPSPKSPRSSATPDMREIASPTLRSGREPTSSATIESIAVAAFFLRSMLDCCEARVATTFTCVILPSSVLAVSCGSCASATLPATSDATASDTATLIRFGWIRLVSIFFICSPCFLILCIRSLPASRGRRRRDDAHAACGAGRSSFRAM